MWKEAVMTEPEILSWKFLNGLRKATQIVTITCVPVEMRNRNFGIRITQLLALGSRAQGILQLRQKKT
jgi:hypothetical protein